MAQRGDWAATLAAGLLVGATATAAMDGYWAVLARLRPPPTSREEPATQRIAEDLMRRVGLRPSRRARRLGGQIVHWGDGIAWAVVAALARRAEVRLDAAFGQPLGAALEVGGDMYGLYFFGYAGPPRVYPAGVIARDFGAHAVYGLALWASLETVHDLSRSNLAERLHLPRAA